MTLTAWEVAARMFEPDRLDDGQLWVRGVWAGSTDAPDRVAVAGQGVTVSYHLPGVDLGRIR